MEKDLTVKKKRLYTVNLTQNDNNVQCSCYYRPMIEMTIPSVLDPTLAPPGCHVMSFFTQFTPYLLDGGRAWTDEDREKYANTG